VVGIDACSREDRAVTDPAEHEPTTALLEHTIGMVNEVARELPPDAGVPPILLTDGPRGVNVLQFAPPGNDQDNEETAYAVTANIAVLRATEVVFLAGVWLTNPGPDGAATAENPSAAEAVVILHGTADGQRMLFADVIRTDGQPPVVGPWTAAPVDETQGLGTFGDAVRYGLRLAADLGTAEQDEVRQLVDDILDKDGTKAAMRVLLAIWRQARG